tara:strand:- start:407 stop:598 length:192 start_codon:yes stop_codon:yes gene_type:complete
MEGFDMLELNTKVRLLDAVGEQVETGVLVGRTCESEPHYDIRLDSVGLDRIRTNIPADRIVVV